MRLTQCFYVGGLVAGAGGRQPEASAMQQMIDGHCSDTRLHERRIVMREASKVVVIEWGKRNLNRLAFNASTQPQNFGSYLSCSSLLYIKMHISKQFVRVLKQFCESLLH